MYEFLRFDMLILLFAYAVRLDTSSFCKHVVCTLLLVSYVHTACLRCRVVKSALAQTSDVWVFSVMYSSNACHIHPLTSV